MARYLVEAHVLEGRPVGELAAAHGVHRSWIYKLLAATAMVVWRRSSRAPDARAPASTRPHQRSPRQTCGKIERLHQTLKRYLDAQEAAKTLSELQQQLERFVHYYNDIRPHRALGGRTPLQAYSARVKAKPALGTLPTTHFRVRQDKVDDSGTVTLRHMSRLHHIGLGRAHKGRQVKLLIADQNIA